MKIVWKREQAPVRDVYEDLLERRKIAYTTVMTMMKILEQKKYLRKSQDDRAYVYRPSQPKNKVIKGMVHEFVDRVFNGSAEPLLVSSATCRSVAVTSEAGACNCSRSPSRTSAWYRKSLKRAMARLLVMKCASISAAYAARARFWALEKSASLMTPNVLPRNRRSCAN